MIIVITAIQARTNTFVTGSKIKFVRCPECGAQFQDKDTYIPDDFTGDSGQFS